MIWVASSSRFIRTPTGSHSPKPYASYSRWCQPAPIPRIVRPWLIWSSVVAIFAVRAGLRYGIPSTSCPRRIRSVIAAMAARAVKHSMTGSGSGWPA